MCERAASGHEGAGRGCGAGVRACSWLIELLENLPALQAEGVSGAGGEGGKVERRAARTLKDDRGRDL